MVIPSVVHGLIILLVEDNPADAKQIRKLLKLSNGITIKLTHVSSLKEALLALKNKTFEVILLDLGLPDSHGLGTFREIKFAAPDIPILILAGFQDKNVALQALKEGAQDYLFKSEMESKLLMRFIRYAMERKQVSVKLTQLNQVLRAIRNINQMIVQEKDRKKLFRKTCSILYDSRPLVGIWITILDENKKVNARFHRGFDQEYVISRKQIEQSSVPDCIHRVLEHSGVMTIEDSKSECHGCPLAGKYPGNRILISRLEYGEKIYGFLSVVFSKAYVPFEEEESLFREVAGDLAFALHSIELEEKQKLVEETVREERDLFQTFIDALPDGIFFKDDRHRFIRVNRAKATEQQTSPEEMIGKTDFDYFPREIARKSFQDDEQVLKTGNPIISRVEKIQHADGSEHWVSVTKLPRKNVQGKIVGTMGIARDITEQKHTEDRIRESEERYRALVENSQAGIILVGDDFNFIYVNDAFCKILDRERDEIVGHDFREFLDDKSRALVADRYQRRQQGEEVPTRYEFNVVRKGGEVRNVEISSAVVKDSRGRVSTIAQLLDITERKKAEAEIRKLSQAVDQSPASIVLTDTDGNIVYVNNAFTQITGYASEEVLGENPRILQSGKTPREVYKELWDTITAGGTWQGEFYNKKKNGGFYWESALITPVQSHDGKIINYLAVKEDITERKQMILELIEARVKAEESDRLKSAFLANMSHEIRTPLNGVLGFADLLEKSGLSEAERKEFIRMIKQSGERLLETLNNLIDVSKIEAGLVEVSLREVNVNKIMDEIHRFFVHAAGKKGIDLVYEEALHPQETIIICDEVKIRSILTNLVNNAIKFTDQGNVTFGYRDKGDNLEFFVRDTGRGIPADRQKVIFDRFVQADMTITRPHEGSGLGLFIAKSYVELLGGTIWLKSEEGEGSRFYFTLPKNRNGTKSHTDKDIPSAGKTGGLNKKLKILVAEDDEASRIYLEKILGDISREILFAKSGLKAVEICRNHPDIDLVLMDIKLPGLNGYDATRQIRKFNKDVIIIAQTAFAMADDREKALEAGCNNYIPKPLKKEKLFNILAEYKIGQ